MEKEKKKISETKTMCEHYIAITLPEEQEAAVFPGGFSVT